MGTLWFSPTSAFWAVAEGTALRVSGPGCDAQLTGTLAQEFLEAFLHPQGGSAPRLQALADMGQPVHRALFDAGRSGGGQAWTTLATIGGPPIVFLELTGRCNERCVHCYADAGPEVRDALDEDTCLRVIRESRALGFERLQLTGGDPLLCPFVVSLAREARAVGFSQVEVYTNGLALSDERLEALARFDAAFAFSFYSHDPEKHDRVTRVPGSHEKTTRAIRRAVERGLSVRAGIIAVDAGAEDVDATRNYLAALGVSRQAMTADVVHGVGRGKDDLLTIGTRPTAQPAPSFPAWSTASHGATVSAEPSGPWNAQPRWPGKICVSYTGTVYPCIFARSLPLGNVATESLTSIVEGARKKKMSGSMNASDLACLDCRMTVLSQEGASA